MSAATVTTGQAAELLDVSDRTIRRFADRGDLKPVRLTPRSPRRYKLEDVVRLLERAHGAAA